MHHRQLTRLSALLGSLMISSLAQAGITNGDFANGLSGWQTFGDVAAPNSTLVLTTATLGADDYPLANGHYNVSGQDAGAIGIPGGLEDFVGAALGSLDPDPINHTSVLWEGSAAQQSFAVQAGDTLRFDWNLLSADRDFADQAFIVIKASSGSGLQVLALANASLATNVVPGNSDLRQTGLNQLSHTFTGSGMVTLFWVVADLDDSAKTSLLTVDNVALTSAVPEPTMALLALLGLGGWGVMRRRQG
ncbi:PEP-CTERM sorting domain-containing protein [Aquabacterium sp.]|uniref:PEP-CTERM sorting domain-containing protein n=1 Tax=Aquabacterium sp. TaxID=1872578 RepID=UPI0019A82A25|nr:PEP-CTERM sorting domain-containing protein [Aquabacterium sp.]MBC7701132.1 PEP-CTERM sorting domain-containing protein [Aquabacterium sp.]